MGNACDQLSQSGHFLLMNDLMLGCSQLIERVGEFSVFFFKTILQVANAQMSPYPCQNFFCLKRLGDIINPSG